MTHYTIQIDYTTGDSFNSERRTDTVGMVWQDLDSAKLGLQYIKEHYAAYEATDSWHRKPALNIRDIKNRPWFNGPHDTEQWKHSLLLEKDELGEFQVVSPYWCGYFETLHGAEIITEGDSDMSFKL